MCILFLQSVEQSIRAAQAHPALGAAGHQTLQAGHPQVCNRHVQGLGLGIIHRCTGKTSVRIYHCSCGDILAEADKNCDILVKH